MLSIVLYLLQMNSLIEIFSGMKGGDGSLRRLGSSTTGCRPRHKAETHSVTTSFRNPSTGLLAVTRCVRMNFLSVFPDVIN
jgi:hypothetical protein